MALTQVGEAEGTDRKYAVMSDGSYRIPGRKQMKSLARAHKRDAHKNRVPRSERYGKADAGQEKSDA